MLSGSAAGPGGAPDRSARPGVNQPASSSSSGSMRSVVAARRGPEAQHQRCRERPGLRRAVAACPRPRRRPPRRPRGAPSPPAIRRAPRSRPASSTCRAESGASGRAGSARRAVAVGHQHDHRGVGAREVLGAADRAAPDVAALHADRGVAAHAAVAVAGCASARARGHRPPAGLVGRQQAPTRAARRSRPLGAAARPRSTANRRRRPPRPGRCASSGSGSPSRSTVRTSAQRLVRRRLTSTSSPDIRMTRLRGSARRARASPRRAADGRRGRGRRRRRDAAADWTGGSSALRGERRPAGLGHPRDRHQPAGCTLRWLPRSPILSRGAGGGRFLANPVRSGRKQP